VVEKTLILHPKVFSSTKFYFLSIEKALIAAFPTINQTLENPPITPPSLSLLVLLILYYYSLLACPVYTFSTKNSCFSFSTTTPCSLVSSTRFLRLLCFFSSLPRYRSASINTSLAVRRFGTCNYPFHLTVRSRHFPPLSLFPRTRLGVCIGSTFPRFLRQRSVLLQDPSIYKLFYRHSTFSWSPWPSWESPFELLSYLRLIRDFSSAKWLNTSPSHVSSSSFNSPTIFH